MDEQRGNKTHPKKKVCDLISNDDNLPRKRWVDEKWMDGERERGGGGVGVGGGKQALKQKVVEHILHDDDPYPLTLLRRAKFQCFFFHFFHIQNFAKFNTHKIRQKVFLVFFFSFPPTYLPTYLPSCLSRLVLFLASVLGM
jgi:hypothetical protein